MRKLERDTRIINVAGSMGTIYGRLAHAELLLLFVTRCLGMPKEQWASILAVLPLANILHILGAYLTERFHHRKYIVIIPFMVARTAIPALMVLPFINGGSGFNYYFLLIALFVHAGLSAVGASPWWSWIADMVPPGSRGRFYSKRFIVTNACDAVFMVMGGVMLDFFAARNGGGYSNPHSYLFIFGAAFVLGELDLILHLFVKERKMQPQDGQLNFTKLTLEPWRHKDYRKFMIVRSFFAIMDGILGPFSAMYLFDEVGISATDYGVLMMLFLITSSVSFRYWQKFGDRAGYRSVLTGSSTFAGIIVIFWWFLPYQHKEIAIFSIALSFMCAGVGISGVNLALNTLALNVAPEKNRSMFTAQVAVIYSIAVAIAVFVGRLVFIYTDPAVPVVFLGTKLTGVHVLVGLFALVRIIGGMWISKLVPDELSEKARPHLNNLLKTNPLSLLKLMEGEPVVNFKDDPARKSPSGKASARQQ